MKQKIQAAVEQFKTVVRPIMIGSRVYHHTPLLPMMEATPWLVLEYATPDSRRAVAGLFRTSHLGDSTYRFYPRGLDFAHSYKVQFGNSGQTVEIPCYRLLQDGIPIRIENAMGSEMLIFESK